MANLNQTIHIEEDVAERVECAWEFRPSSGYVRNQEYVVMCVVAPHGTNQKCSDLAVKIFGCFPTKESADKYAAQLSTECNCFDYYVATTMDWLKLPPQVESIDDVNYQEEALNNIKQRMIDMRSARAKLLQERIEKDRIERKQNVQQIGNEERKS